MDKIDLRPISVFYHAEHNKRLIYYVVLGLWVFTLTLCHAMMSLFPLSEGKASSYIILLLTAPVIYGATHWLLVCLISVQPSELTGIRQPITNTYSVASDIDLRVNDM